MTKEQLEKIAAASAKERKARQERSMEEAIAIAKELDTKRNIRKKVRKTPTKEEKAAKELEAMLQYKPSEVKEPEPELKHQKTDDEWDVKITDKIEYFDPNLSYELTGYRPITQTQGLDFDPKLFTVMADTYRKTGSYTALLPGTFAHRQFWQREFDRCKNGVTIGKYTLTGENYFFLNYYRLLSVFSNSSGDEIRQEDFPGFLAKQYEYFHYIELCKKSGYDVMAFKARGIN